MPEEEPKIYGDNLPEEAIMEAREVLIEKRQEGAEPIKGEERKSRQDREVIGFVNWAIEQEFQELNLSKPNLLTPERIHFLPEKIYRQRFPQQESSAFYANVFHAAYFAMDRNSRPALYIKILHEAIHAASSRSFWMDVSAERKIIKDLRGGVITYHPQEEAHEHLRGLNEALVDFATWKLMGKYESQIRERFDFDLQSLGFEYQLGRTNVPRSIFYTDYMLVFDNIVREMQKRNGEDTKDIFERFEKSLFTGEILHLGDIDRTFGKGSLRFLAALGSDTSNLPREEIEKRAIKFFETDDQAEKDKIASEVLNERERLRYFQQRKKK